ncbi:MAG: tetratricopeptide repeat protein [Bacteroidota bacterium]
MERSGTRLAAKAQNRIGNISYKAKKYEDAEREYKQTYVQYLNSSEGRDAGYHLGKIYYAMNRFTESKNFLQEYLQSNPTDISAQWSRYIYVMAVGKSKDPEFPNVAKEYFTSSRDSLLTKDENVRYQLTGYLADQRSWDQAITEGKKLIDEFPGSRKSKTVEGHIADYYYLLGKPSDAISFCRTLLKKYLINTDDAARAQHILATMYMNMREFARARAEYSKISKVHPEAVRWVGAAEFSQGLADLTEGRIKNDSSLVVSARNRLQLFVSQRPTDRHVPRALMNLADLYISIGRYDEALSAYDGIARFDERIIAGENPSSISNDVKAHRELVVNAHLQKGNLLRSQLQRPLDALAEFQAVLDKNPASADARLNMAICLMDLGRTTESRQILQNLSRDDSNMRDVARQLLNSSKTTEGRP